MLGAQCVLPDFQSLFDIFSSSLFVRLPASAGLLFFRSEARVIIAQHRKRFCIGGILLRINLFPQLLCLFMPFDSFVKLFFLLVHRADIMVRIGQLFFITGLHFFAQIHPGLVIFQGFIQVAHVEIHDPQIIQDICQQCVIPDPMSVHIIPGFFKIFQSQLILRIFPTDIGQLIEGIGNGFMGRLRFLFPGFDRIQIIFDSRLIIPLPHCNSGPQLLHPGQQLPAQTALIFPADAEYKVTLP